MAYRVNYKLWVGCSLVVLCLLFAFDPRLGGKFWPLRAVMADAWRHHADRAPAAIVLEFTAAALLIYGIPAAAVGWVMQAVAIVAWSKISKSS